MKFLELKNQLAAFPIFTTLDIRKLSPGFYPARLAEWIKKGYIVRIAKGLYVFSDAHRDEFLLSSIANRLVVPSAISLEAALAHYGFIPEGVYSLTSVTPRRTAMIKTPFGTFIYRKVMPALMFGLRAEGEGALRHRIAEPEKAVLDYFYLNPQLKTAEDFEGLRFNAEVFLRLVDSEKLERYLALFKNKALARRVHDFLMHLRSVLRP